MPLAAWLLALIFHMPPELSAGMVLVGSVASGTASNVMIFLAKGDVALSVTISSVSTLVGVVATPLLTRLYVDAHIQVDVMGMLLSILQIVVIPIALGLVVHHLLPKVVKAVEPFLPAFSMVCILAIICAVVAGSASHIASVGFVVIIAVILHNTIGLLGGYLMDAVAAAWIGFSLAGSGKPNALGTLVGAVILGVLSNGLVMLSVPYYAMDIIKGLVLAGALALTYFQRRT